jgi:hypothetical protein
MISDATFRVMLRSVGGTQLSTDSGSLLGFFDNEFIEGAEIEGRQPVLTCATPNVVALGLRKGSLVTVEGETYRVRRHEPNGDGMSRLILEQ